MLKRRPPGYKFAFVDAEYTGEHARTTLVSIAIVGEDGSSVYVAFDDFAREQVTPWLEENVLAFIPPEIYASKLAGWKKIMAFLESYRDGQNISLVSFGKMQDLVLLFELWHAACPEREFFHSLYCLPDWLNHAAHFDMPTIFLMSGIDPNTTREELLGAEMPIGQRHDALFDAVATRACFLKCIDGES